MKARLLKRLAQLEQVGTRELHVAGYQEQEEQARLVREKMIAWIHAQGEERQPHESLAEAVARVSGITVSELRHQLTERAAGRL